MLTSLHLIAFHTYLPESSDTFSWALLPYIFLNHPSTSLLGFFLLFSWISLAYLFFRSNSEHLVGNRVHRYYLFKNISLRWLIIKSSWENRKIYFYYQIILNFFWRDIFFCSFWNFLHLRKPGFWIKIKYKSCVTPILKCFTVKNHIVWQYQTMFV